MEKKENDFKAIESEDIVKLSNNTGRTFRVVIGGRPNDLPVYEIPIKFLYFNIENGRYRDRMIKLRADHPGVNIDPREVKWRDEIRDMLLGASRYTIPGWGDKTAAERLEEDIKEKTQLTPGLVGRDGGVLDGNRRLAVLIELGKECFEGVILPENISSENKWRVEAGLQLGKPLIHEYSAVNELLKVREGLEIFKTLKRDGRDPSPRKSPEQLVADAIYGRDENEIKEWLARIELMDQYLEFLGRKDRYDIIGDRSERFLEALRIIEAAKNQSWSPGDMKKLKAWLFHQLLEGEISNWDLRKIYKMIGGDPSKKGRKMKGQKKARVDFIHELPDADLLRDICKAKAGEEDIVNKSKQRDAESPRVDKRIKYNKIENQSKDLKDKILDLARKEKEEETPLQKLKEAQERLEAVRESTSLIKESGKKDQAIGLLVRIKDLAVDCRELLRK